MRGKKSKRSKNSITYDVYAGTYMGSLVATPGELRKLFGESRTRKRSRKSRRSKRLPRYTYTVSGEVPSIDYKVSDSYSVSGYSSESPKPKQPKTSRQPKPKQPKTSKQRR